MNDRKENLPIVVVGAGILGASIAFNLASRGAAVILMEAGEPGLGASYVSFAWINAREKTPRHYQDLNRRSVDMWDRFARRLGGDVGLVWGGELRWAATSAGAQALADRVGVLQSWGYPIYLLTKAEAEALEPGLRFGLLAAASFTTVDGHVDTGKVIAACLARAREMGARIRTDRRVTGLKLAADGAGGQQVEAVMVDGEAMSCRAVVLAGGPDNPDLLALAGLQLPLENTFGATLITEPLPPILKHAAVVHSAPDRPLPVVFRQFPDGSVMVHGGDAATATGSLGSDEAEVERVFSAAEVFLPALKGARIVEVRRGRRPVPQDGRSIVGFTQAIPNLYVAATHSGVTLAPLIGEFASLEILDRARVDILEPYRLERF